MTYIGVAANEARALCVRSHMALVNQNEERKGQDRTLMERCKHLFSQVPCCLAGQQPVALIISLSNPQYARFLIKKCVQNSGLWKTRVNI